MHRIGGWEVGCETKILGNKMTVEKKVTCTVGGLDGLLLSVR